jgi:hypothetical protein
MFDALIRSNFAGGLVDIVYHILQQLIVTEYDKQHVQKLCKI